MPLLADLTLTPLAMGSLALAMALLAALPSLSVLAVTTRALSGGVAQGAWAALGIVVGDFIYLAVAWLGLSGLRQLPEWLLRTLVWLAAAWLIWLAWRLWCDARQMRVTTMPDPLAASASPGAFGNAQAAGARASFATGLSLTLADQKAIAFYLGFLPAFVDLQHWTLTDAVVVFAITGVSVGGVKLGYAVLAHRVGQWLSPMRQQGLLRLAAVILALAAAWLAIRAAGLLP